MISLHKIEARYQASILIHLPLCIALSLFSVVLIVMDPSEFVMHDTPS
jgi:hypothetical protein